MTDPAEVIARAVAPHAWADYNFLGNEEWRDLTLVRARNAITALREKGMAIVPIEPTESMVSNGGKSILHVQGWGGGSVAASLCWRKMISTWLNR